jgi:hypothetical protein
MITSENKGLREDFYKCISDVKELYKSGKLILTPANLQKLQLYFQNEKVLQVAGMNDLFEYG